MKGLSGDMFNYNFLNLLKDLWHVWTFKIPLGCCRGCQTPYAFIRVRWKEEMVVASGLFGGTTAVETQGFFFATMSIAFQESLYFIWKMSFSGTFSKPFRPRCRKKSDSILGNVGRQKCSKAQWSILGSFLNGHSLFSVANAANFFEYDAWDCRRSELDKMCEVNSTIFIYIFLKFQ